MHLLKFNLRFKIFKYAENGNNWTLKLWLSEKPGPVYFDSDYTKYVLQCMKCKD